MAVSVRVQNARVASTPGLRRLGMGRTLFLVLILTLAGLFYAYSVVKSTSASYLVSRGVERQRELREEARRLKVELNILKAPGRLERQGRRLGLAAPLPAQKRVLK